MKIIPKENEGEKVSRASRLVSAVYILAHRLNTRSVMSTRLSSFSPKTDMLEALERITTCDSSDSSNAGLDHLERLDRWKLDALC